MIQNYLKIAWRNLWKTKIFSIINILGFSVGIAFTMLIGAYTWGEIQVNLNLKNSKNQYVIHSKWKNPDMGIETTSVAELAKALKTSYPDLVVNYYSSAPAVTNVSKDEKHFREHLQVGDSTLLTMYGFKLSYGNAWEALKDPFSIIITTETANKYFDKTNVIGQTLNIEDFAGGNHDYIITGVLDEIPENTISGLGSDKIQIFVNGSLNTSLRHLEGWENSGYSCHIELQRGVNPKTVERAMLDLINRNEPDLEIKNNLTPYLVPMSDQYVLANNHLVFKMIWTLCYIAFFILLMVAINYINISIGSSSNRMKEMGMRKVMGGLRKHLIVQFLSESLVVMMLSTAFAFIIFFLARPYFSDALGRSILGIFDFPVYFIFFLFVFAFIMGILAGIYPAIVSSSTGTIDLLKGKLNSVKENIWLRKILVAVQFSVGTIVIISAIIIAQQVNLFFNGSLGYDKDNIVYVPVPRDWSFKGVKKMEGICYQLARIPQVNSTTLSWQIPGGMDVEWRKSNIYKEGTSELQGITTQNLIVDNQFAKTFSIPLLAGQFFNPSIEADSNSVVINETERKALGWQNPGDAIGQHLVYQGKVFSISGVTSDFHFGSMREHIEPILFTNVYFINNFRYISLKLAPGNLQQNIEILRKKWSELIPQAPFEYHFMDDTLSKLYASEIQLKKAAYISTVLALVIVILGILGLVSLSIQKRTKEIGIRKLLGSSVGGIMGLFLKDISSVVSIACLIACPIAWLIMHNWLNNYAYKIRISLMPFVLSVVILNIITVILIALQTMKVAFSNPINSLKNNSI